MVIRRERPADHPAIRTILADAFADPATPSATPAEVGLVDALRVSPAWIPPLSLLAQAPDGAPTGYVVCTRGHIDARPALALGPLAVTPTAQRAGVGTALMHAVIATADALDEPLIALLGHTTYYPRFGFQPATRLGITPPVAAWGPHFQARALTRHQPDLTGTFHYPPAFDGL